ncbi:MAG: hypothetical protein LIO93_06825 [Bacteroidales bacterium]|nr:hypothetical protein [Bacteroidales bacterium]
MKKSFLILLSLITFLIPAFSQHSLQPELNMYRSGDRIFKQQVGDKDPGRPGENVLWDFSRLEILNDEYELAYTEHDNSIITGTEHLTHYHYTLRNDSLLLTGFENQTTELKNHQPELVMEFPFRYGDRKKSYFYGHGTYGNRLEMDVMGTVETTADAYGMMILPNKDTLKHVLRTRSVKYIAEETQPIGPGFYRKQKSPPVISQDSIDTRLQDDPVVFVVETFRWYEKGYRYPVFETFRSWEQYKEPEMEENEFLNTAFFYPPQEHYYLEDDNENLAVLEEGIETGENPDPQETEEPDPWEGLTYNIYPNPVRMEPLGIELYLPREADIRIQVRNPMGLLEIDDSKGYHPAGTCNFSLPFSRLAVGNYVLDVWLDDKLISEIIMKR